MSSSESDEFESADESFDDENNVKEPKVNINRDKCRNKLSVSLIKSDETVEKEENNEMINKEKDIVDEIEENVEEEIVMAIAEIVKEERENLLNTLNVKTKTVVDEMSDSHEKPVSAASTPDFQADGWEFDDWGDEESINKSLPQLNLKKDTDLSIDDKDEWNFEDWGDNSTNQDSKQLTVASTTLLTTSESDSRDIIKKEDGSQISLVFDKLANEKSSGWKSWGNVASFITSASESVASITTNVSKGISNVIESSIGIPEPEELVKLQHEKKNLSVEVGSEEHTESSVEDTSSLGKIVSGVTQMSNRVIAGGLDTLEGIGKKTMNMLQENDPLLLNKRKMLGLDSERTILSQVLREAKNKTEENEKNLKAMQKHMYKKQIHFETLFDGYHGLVHLEALEMLSKQSSLKLQSLLAPLSGKALQDLQETLNEVRELCELPDTDNDEVDGMHTTSDLNEKLAAATEDLGVTVEFNEILKCWEDNVIWISEKHEESQEIHDKAIHCLAQSTALAVHKLHKLAEVLLILNHHSTANEADGLVQLTSILCWHLSGIATRFSNKISELASTNETSAMITSIFMEGSNSTSYVKKTFQLFIPILQMGAA